MTWLALLLALLWLASLLRWRGQVARIPVLGAEPAGASEPTGAPDDDGFVFVTARGVELDDGLRGAAAAHARAHGLEVLDLVPTDLPAERLVVFASVYEPQDARALFSPGRTARCALCVSRDVAERAELSITADVEPLAFADLARRLKAYAPRAYDSAAAPGLRANVEPARWRRPLQRAALGFVSPFYSAFELVILVALGATLVGATPFGLAALALNHLAPIGAAAGSAFRPRDTWATLLLRAPRSLWRWVYVLVGPRFDPEGVREEIRAKRKVYEAQLADGVEALFEPRRDTCPLCGGTHLEPYLQSPDMLQHKPGVFTIERCADCGHLFQNPRLTPAGLGYYYGDFYDGLGRRLTETVFGIGDDRRYLARADMVRAHVDGRPQPERWLDVGGGYGHFCLAAKDVFPDTRFDVLDLSDGVEEGTRRGWVEHGYRGLFPELSGEIPQYDVLSMSHYLEHTREPEEEVRAAARALKPGGLFMLEMPNGPATTGRRLGRWWLPFFQPQHLHLPSLANLEQLLTRNGFEIVERHPTEAHSTGDYVGACFLLIKAVAGPADAPWVAPRTWLQRLRHALAWTVLAPLVPLGYALDGALLGRARTPEESNAYRVLARKPAAPAAG